MITILKLATVSLRYVIAIKELNNITINCLTYFRLRVLLDKWKFDISGNWKILENDFGSVSLDTISENILQALGFHISSLSYLEKETSQFVDITNEPKLAIDPESVKNNQEKIGMHS